MKKVFLFLSILSLFACSNKEEYTADEILDKAITVSGTEKLYDATISFNYKDVEYKAFRKGNEYRYAMTREKENVTYLAVTYNGGFEYTENGIAKSYGAQNQLVENQLHTILNFMAIPQVFKDDHTVTVSRKADITIKGVPYYTVHLSYPTPMPTNLIHNFNLYIDQESYKINYIGYDFMAGSEYYFFRESFNRRTVEGVTINDYHTFQSVAPIQSLDSLPLLYEQNTLKIQSDFTPGNVKIDFSN